jgi:predicted ester cyclase
MTQSRAGTVDVSGKVVEWDAIAMFRFKDGKIVEEWVSPDELGQPVQIGTVQIVVGGQ